MIAFGNAGTFERAVSTGATHICAPFTNTGRVLFQAETPGVPTKKTG
jgi:hypothetical protein